MIDFAIEAIVIGASAGAVEALSAILPTLPAHYSLPVIVVVHVPPDKKTFLVEVFGQKCRMKVQEAEDKENIRGGVIYFAPSNYHLLVEKDHFFSLSDDEPVRFSRPSIDVLFESAAGAYGPHLVGVILTGANEDGADGLTAVSRSGGTAVVQRPDEAFAPAMPQAALAACPDARVLSLEEIAVYLQEV